jgi:gamma-glutamyltranspeptidase / glutathione hydrolase
MVACSQPLAAEVGLRMLRSGANAAEAAVATAAAMAVLEPCSTGLGRDAFALYYNSETRTVEGLNGSGRSSSALTLDRFVSA